MAKAVVEIKENKGTSAYDADATITSVKNEIVTVQIDGGVENTPCECTLSCKPGDRVKVRVADGRCWITGNLSAPPTDDTKANNAKVKADQAQKTATEANTVATTIKQHFWTDDTGVHISNEVDENGNGKPDGAKNSWWNSLGMLFRKGVNNIVAILAGNAPNTRGMAIYDGEGNGEENVIAKFTGEGARIGKTNGLSCMNITPRNMQLTAYNEAYNSRQHIIDIGVLNNPDTGGYNVRIKPEIHLEEYPAGSGTRYAAISLLSPCLPNSVQLFKKEPVSTVITGIPLTLDPSNYMYIITDNEGVPHPDDTIGGDNMLFHMVSFSKSHFETHPIDLNVDIYIQTNTQVTLNNGTVVPAGTRKPLFNVFYWVDFYEGLNDYVYCIENDTFELIQKGQTDLVPYMNEFNEVPYNSLPFEYIANNMAIIFVGITDKNAPRVKAISSVTYDSTFLRPYFTYGYRNASAPIGLHSITLGDRNSAEDDYTTAIGRENRVTGEHSTAIGSGNTISGANSFSFGFENTVAKNDSCVIGTGNDVSKQDFISMIGTGLIDGDKNAKVAPYATILGVSNKPVSNSIFQVGAGKYDKRENAINVSANGRLTLANHDSWVGKVEYVSKNVQITSSNTGMDKKVVGASKTLGAGVWVITAYAGFNTGAGSGTRGIDISLRLSNDVLRRTRVYNVNQNWAELNLTYIANISKPTTYFVCKSATTAEKQAEFTVLHAVRIF